MRKKLTDYSIYCLGILAFLALLLLSVRYVLPVLLPFIIAWLIASFTRAPAEKISERIKIPARVCRLLLSLLFVCVFISAVGVLVWQIIFALRGVLEDVSEGGKLYEFLNALFSPDIPFLGDKIPEELSQKIGEAIGSMVGSVMSALAGGITTFVAGLPKIFLFILVTLISLVYFSLDYDRLLGFLRDLLPERVMRTASSFCNGTLRVIGKYIRSYTVILLITYLTVFFGFMLLSVERAATVALLVALLDLLPIIGVGPVLIPWGVFEIAMGSRFLGIGLIILFVVNAIIRQLAEPKIVGKSLNIHPIITLMLLYIGYALLGFVGLIILPVLAVSIGVMIRNRSDDNSSSKVN